MNTQLASKVEDHDKKPVSIPVKVNGHPVTFHEKKTTGAEIKAAAIAASVPIAVDFALFEVKGPGKLHPVGDNDEVRLQDEMEFRAVAPDDNS